MRANRPDPDRLRATFGASPMTVRAITKYDKMWAVLSRTPPTLGEKIAQYGGYQGQEPTPWGEMRNVDLSPFADRDPDNTFIVLVHSVSPPELAGQTSRTAAGWFRSRLGMDA